MLLWSCRQKNKKTHLVGVNNACKKANIVVNRKMLADLAVRDPEAFDVIFETIERAKALGDENIYIIDCYGCFGELERGECGTVDNTHPDSLGFLRMAEALLPVLKKVLNEE